VYEICGTISSPVAKPKKEKATPQMEKCALFPKATDIYNNTRCVCGKSKFVVKVKIRRVGGEILNRGCLRQAFILRQGWKLIGTPAANNVTGIHNINTTS